MTIRTVSIHKVLNSTEVDSKTKMMTSTTSKTPLAPRMMKATLRQLPRGLHRIGLHTIVVDLALVAVEISAVKATVDAKAIVPVVDVPMVVGLVATAREVITSEVKVEDQIAAKVDSLHAVNAVKADSHHEGNAARVDSHHEGTVVKVGSHHEVIAAKADSHHGVIAVKADSLHGVNAVKVDSLHEGIANETTVIEVAAESSAGLQNSAPIPQATAVASLAIVANEVVSAAENAALAQVAHVALDLEAADQEAADLATAVHAKGESKEADQVADDQDLVAQVAADVQAAVAVDAQVAVDIEAAPADLVVVVGVQAVADVNPVTR